MHLFKKDIFSVHDPLYTKAGDALKAIIMPVLRWHYPALEVKEIYCIGALELNSNNFKIVSDNAIYILKRAGISKAKTLAAQATWASELQKNNFPVLRFLENRNGMLISTDEEYTYCITYFENGSYFGRSKNEWPSLLFCLKKLYDQSLQQNETIATDFPVRDFFTDAEEYLITKLKSKPELPQITKGQVLYTIDKYEEAKTFFSSPGNNCHNAVFHVDVHPHNLIFRDNDLVLLTDFEAFQKTSTEISLGFGLYKCMRQLLALETDFNETLARTLKAEFENIFPQHDFIRLLKLGSIDVLKRVLYVFLETQQQGESKWLFILQTQLTALQEIDELEKMLN